MERERACVPARANDYCLFAGRVQLRQSCLQVSRSVRVLQPEDLLAATPNLPGGRRPLEGPLRRRHGDQVQQPGHQTQAQEPALQQAQQGGPHLPGRLSGLLHRQPRDRLPRDRGAGVQPQLSRDGRVHPDVLWAGLQHLQAEAGGEVSLQVLLVLLCPL